MSRQFRCFLLPADIRKLMAELREEIGVTLIDTYSSGSSPNLIDSPMRDDPPLEGRKASRSAHCYLAAKDADIRLSYIATQGYWVIDEERSEVIQFTGFKFDGETLVEGRFYFKTNFLLGEAIWPKRDAFLHWAGRIFRQAKRHLTYSKELDSYLGSEASAWRTAGRGQFAWMRVAGGAPLSVDDQNSSS